MSTPEKLPLTIVLVAVCLVCGLAAGYFIPQFLSGSASLPGSRTATPGHVTMQTAEPPAARPGSPGLPGPVSATAQSPAAQAPVTATPQGPAVQAPVTATPQGDPSPRVPLVTATKEVIEWPEPPPKQRRRDYEGILTAEEEKELERDVGEAGAEKRLPPRPEGGNPIQSMRDSSGLFIEVTRKTHSMRLYHAGELVDRFKITVGKPDKANHTPSGVYAITEIVSNPTWHVPARVQKEEKLPASIKPFGTFKGKTKKDGNQNALGVLWIGLRWTKNWNSRDRGRAESGLGIHGTNEPERIGGSWGHGCVRMKNEDIRKVERLIRKYGRENTRLVVRKS